MTTISNSNLTKTEKDRLQLISHGLNDIHNQLNHSTMESIKTKVDVAEDIRSSIHEEIIKGMQNLESKIIEKLQNSK